MITCWNHGPCSAGILPPALRTIFSTSFINCRPSSNASDPPTMTANGPPPTTLVFLNDLSSLRPGSKVRFLGW